MNLKQILISILVGATVAFLTTLLEGLLGLLQDPVTPAVGGVAGTTHYLLKWRTNLTR